MSKTYTLPCTLRGWTKSSNSSVLDYTTESGDYYVGHNSSAYFACSAAPTDSATMQRLYNLYAAASSNITSIKILVTPAALSNAYNTRIGPLAVLPTAGSKVTTNNAGYTVNAGTSTTTIDITSLGITNKLGYGLGNYSSSATVRWKLSTVSLKIVTAETDYVLKYDANGGSGAPSQQSGTGIGSYSFTVSSTIPVWEGHNFLGWATSASATTATYHGGDTYTATGSGTTVTKTLYAVWEEVSTGGFHIKTASGFVDGTPYVKTASGIVEGTVWVCDANGTLQPAE